MPEKSEGRGMDLADFLGPAAKFLAKTGAIEKLIMSLTDDEREKFLVALGSKLCFRCGKTGNPPGCNCYDGARPRRKPGR